MTDPAQLFAKLGEHPYWQRPAANEERLVLKLCASAAHPLPEVGLRSAKSLLFKLKNGLLGSNELVSILDVYATLSWDTSSSVCRALQMTFF